MSDDSPPEFDPDGDTLPLVGSRNCNRNRRTHEMLAGVYVEEGTFLGEALAQHGLPRNFWLPPELAIQWKSDDYPRYRTRESYRQWEDLQREVLGFKRLSATTPGFVPEMLADWEHDRALIARFDPSLAASDTIDTSADAANGAPLESAVESTPGSSTGFLGGTPLADALGVHETQRMAFSKKLERERSKLADGCWIEAANRLPNAPQYLYLASEPFIQSLAAPYRQPKPT